MNSSNLSFRNFVISGMRHSNFILLYWRKEQKEFNKNLRILRHGPDKNAVHDLRVAIKKLRASLKLYAIITDKKDWQSHFIETKKLFTVLGKERDVEICFELLNEDEKKNQSDYGNAKSYLQSMLLTMQSWTHRALKNYSKTELANLTLLLGHGADAPSTEGLIENTIEAINGNLQQIKNYYKKPHKIRKLLKDVYYWLKMLPKNTTPDDSLEKELEKILDDFGAWQNDETLLAKARHFRKDNLPDTFKEYDSLKTLEKNIEERKEKSLKNTLNKTKRLPEKISIKEKS